MKISDSVRGGIFTVTKNGVNHSVNYNIKALKTKFDDLKKECISENNKNK